MQLRLFEKQVERVGNKVFASGGRRGRSGDLIGDAAHGERVEKFFEEELFVNGFKRSSDK